MTDKEKAMRWIESNRIRVQTGAVQHAATTLEGLLAEVRADERRIALTCVCCKTRVVDTGPTYCVNCHRPEGRS